jgi:hypothetical protein
VNDPATEARRPVPSFAIDPGRGWYGLPWYPPLEGWRIWCVDASGHLIAPVAKGLGVREPWTPDQQARCPRNDQHHPPEASCCCGFYICPDLPAATDFARRLHVGPLIVYANVQAYGRALPTQERFDPAGTVRVGGPLSILGPLYAPAETHGRISDLPRLRSADVRPLQGLTVSAQRASPWDEVAPGLFMGGGYTAPEGFDAVVTLWDGAVEPTNEAARMLWPIVDGPAPRSDDLEQVVRWALEHWAAGRRVLVRCQLGLNRSGLVVGRVLVDSGVTPERAVAMIRAARGQRALYNRTFEHLIRTVNVSNRVAS